MQSFTCSLVFGGTVLQGHPAYKEQQPERRIVIETPGVKNLNFRVERQNRTMR